MTGGKAVCANIAAVRVCLQGSQRFNLSLGDYVTGRSTEDLTGNQGRSLGGRD